MFDFQFEVQKISVINQIGWSLDIYTENSSCKQKEMELAILKLMLTLVLNTTNGIVCSQNGKLGKKVVNKIFK